MPAESEARREGLFIIDISKLGLSHEELLEIEKDINAAVMNRLKTRSKGKKPSFLRPPGPPMGLYIK